MCLGTTASVTVAPGWVSRCEGSARCRSRSRRAPQCAMRSAMSLEFELNKPELTSKCGLRLQSVENGAVTILAVTPGGLASRAGLLAGDELRKAPASRYAYAHACSLPPASAQCHCHAPVLSNGAAHRSTAVSLLAGRGTGGTVGRPRVVTPFAGRRCDPHTGDAWQLAVASSAGNPCSA